MAKWVSPREQRERETARLVAQYRPVVDAAVDALTRDWPTDPDDADKQVSRAVKAALIEAGMPTTGETGYAALVTLQNDCAKSFTARFLAAKRAAEKAAEALVDTNRPVVATIVKRSRPTVGSFAIIAGTHGTEDHTFVCIRTGYVQAYAEEERESGWYSDYAEPSETERQSTEYQRVESDRRNRNRHEAAAQARVDARRQAALDAIRAEGREPTFFEEMFAGTSDD